MPLALINSDLSREKKWHLFWLYFGLCATQAIWGYFAHNFEHHFADYILQIQLSNFLQFVWQLVFLLYLVKC